ncbi:hypothetical protein B0H13DRAFT_1855892 [Mycena leptocephala]|nr:hypothetical protein B0H13DRAFT_1855892 [Mycena leptocephala]
MYAENSVRGTTPSTAPIFTWNTCGLLDSLGSTGGCDVELLGTFESAGGGGVDPKCELRLSKPVWNPRMGWGAISVNVRKSSRHGEMWTFAPVSAKMVKSFSADATHIPVNRHVRVLNHCPRLISLSRGNLVRVKVGCGECVIADMRKVRARTGRRRWERGRSWCSVVRGSTVVHPLKRDVGFAGGIVLDVLAALSSARWPTRPAAPCTCFVFVRAILVNSGLHRLPRHPAAGTRAVWPGVCIGLWAHRVRAIHLLLHGAWSGPSLGGVGNIPVTILVELVHGQEIEVELELLGFGLQSPEEIGLLPPAYILSFWPHCWEYGGRRLAAGAPSSRRWRMEVGWVGWVAFVASYRIGTDVMPTERRNVRAKDSADVARNRLRVSVQNEGLSATGDVQERRLGTEESLMIVKGVLYGVQAPVVLKLLLIFDYRFVQWSTGGSRGYVGCFGTVIPGHARDNADEQVLQLERVAKGVSLTLNVEKRGMSPGGFAKPRGIEQWQARFGVFEMTKRFEGIGAEFDLKEQGYTYPERNFRQGVDVRHGGVCPLLQCGSRAL